MTAYKSYPEAADVPVLETSILDLSEENLAIIRAAVAESAFAVRAAHVYDRKGYFTGDDFAGSPNRSYRGPHDDIVVQISIVVQKTLAAEQYQALSGVYDAVQAAKREADVTAAAAEVAAAEANLAAAQARLDAARTT